METPKTELPDSPAEDAAPRRYTVLWLVIASALVVAGVVLVLNLSGRQQYGPVDDIGHVAVEAAGEGYDVSFSLQDSAGNPTVARGIVGLTIADRRPAEHDGSFAIAILRDTTTVATSDFRTEPVGDRQLPVYHFEVVPHSTLRPDIDPATYGGRVYVIFGVEGGKRVEGEADFVWLR